MRSRTLAPLVTLAASATLLTGCAAPSGADTEGLSVVASTTQMADFSRAVVGDAGSVTQLLQPNASAHSFDPSPADLAALASAQVLVMNGAGLETWLDDAVNASGFDGLTVDASSAVELHHGEEAEHAEDEHADETEHSEDEHADEAEHDHDHGGDDPHIWTSVRNTIEIVHEIAHELGEAEPELADEFEANAEDYSARLEQLDEWATAQIDRVPAEQRLLVSNHDALGYFVEDYGITYVGAVIPSFDDNAELSPADIDELVADIRQTGATAVFAEASLSPETAETIAAEAGVRVFAGEEALYTDSLGPAGSPGDSYLHAQVHNVTQLLAGWGLTADPAPSEVTQ